MLGFYEGEVWDGADEVGGREGVADRGGVGGASGFLWWLDGVGFFERAVGYTPHVGSPWVGFVVTV